MKNLILTCISFLLTTSISSLTFAQGYWKSYDSTLQKWIPRSRADLDSVLNNHISWLKDIGLSEDVDFDVDTLDLRFDSRRADLTQARLLSTNLDSVDLRLAILDVADFTFATLRYANLNSALLRNSRFTDTNLNNCDLTNANLTNSRMDGADLSDCILKNAIFTGADLKRAIINEDALDNEAINETIYWERWDPEYNKYFPSSRKSLKKVLNNHLEWISEFGLLSDDYILLDSIHTYDDRRAVLSKSKLYNANLDNFVLRYAIIDSADLRHASLKNTDFSRASLVKTVFNNALMHGCILSGTKLKKASFTDADLSDAQWREADLTEVRDLPINLRNIDFNNAKFINVDLRNVDLWGADLRNVIYQTDWHPEPHRIANANNLDWIRYENNPTPILELHKLLKEAGFPKAAKQVRTAYHRESKRHNIENRGFIFNSLAWFCDYGCKPWKPLKILFYVWILCSFLYFILLLFTKGEFILKNKITLKEQIEYNIGRRFSKRRLLTRIGRFLVYAIVFSLMSAFNIKFRDIDFGRWIRMLSPYDFEIRTYGIPRIISGIQALLGLFLLSIVFLSLFSNYFDI